MSTETTVKKGLPKWLKWLLWIFGIFILLIIIAWGVLSWYVQHNKPALLKNINQKASEQIHGNVSIGDLDIVFWKDFPSISIRLQDVLVTDSLYAKHHHPLLKSKEIFLRVKVTTLFGNHPDIEKVTVTDGLLYFFVDNNEYSNLYILKGKQDKPKNDKKEIELGRVGLENIDFHYEHEPKHKKMDIFLNSVDALITEEGDVVKVAAPTTGKIGQLGFKLEKGSYLVNKSVKADFHVTYDRRTKIFRMPHQDLEVDGAAVNLDATFRLAENPVTFTLIIDAPSIDLKKGVSFVNRHIGKNFDHVDARDPVAVHAQLDGRMTYPDTPVVRVDFSTRNNLITTPAGDIEKATFKGYFYNYLVPGKGHADNNSIIAIDSIQGVWSDIPFVGDSIVLHNLKDPDLRANIAANFDVTALNKQIGQSFGFTQGKADLKIKYEGPILPKNLGKRAIFGYLKIKDAAMTYRPRNLAFKNVNVNMELNGEDLIMHQIGLKRGGTAIKMTGKADKFLNAFLNTPEKVVIDFNVFSDRINIEDFASFLIPRKGGPQSRRIRNVKNSVGNKLEQLLNQGTLTLKLDVKQVFYQKFLATNLKTNVSFAEAGINLKDIRANHAGGTVSLDGRVDQQKPNNPFTLNGTVSHVNIDQLFAAFSNFGMKSLTSQNLQGIFDAKINISGNLTDEAKLLPKSIAGGIDFSLKDGALVNFPIFEKIKKFVFKKRNLENVTFKDISNKLEIANGRVIISPMAIESSAINMYVKGIYGFDAGTDISLEIPLRNPEKDAKRIARGLQARKRKGITIYLRAKDKEDGGVGITWDAMRRGEQAVDEKLEQLDENGELKDPQIDDVPAGQVIAPAADTTKKFEYQSEPKKKKGLFNGFFRRRKAARSADVK